MSKGYTKKACEGCGRVEDFAFRRQGENCPECKGKMKRYNEIADSLDEDSLDDYVAIAVPYHYHTIYTGNNRANNTDVPEIIKTIIEKASLPIEAIGGTYNGFDKKREFDYIRVGDDRDYGTDRAINRDIANALKELHDVVKSSLIAAHAKGLEEGQNLLLQMNGGNLRMEHFTPSKKDEGNE